MQNGLWKALESDLLYWTQPGVWQTLYIIQWAHLNYYVTLNQHACAVSTTTTATATTACVVTATATAIITTTTTTK